MLKLIFFTIKDNNSLQFSNNCLGCSALVERGNCFLSLFLHVA